MKRTTYLTTSARRCLAAAVLLFVGLLPTLATSHFYYRADVKVSDTGGGRVYISNEATNNPTYATTANVTGDQRTLNDAATKVIYLYAAPNTDWRFDHWEQSNNGSNNSYFPIMDENNNRITTPAYSPLISFDGGQWSRTRFYYQAVFAQQTGAVKVAVPNSEISRGTAVITSNDNNNVVGGFATLLANPDASNGIHFLGWNKSSSDTRNFISIDNPYTINPITDGNKGTYYAHFSQAPENIYCRIQNKATGRFLTLCGNMPAKTHQTYVSGDNRNDGFTFEKSLELISETKAQGNPMTVFLRNGVPDPSSPGITNQTDLTANNIHYQSLVGDNKYLLTFLKSNKGIQIFTSYTSNGYTFNSYLTDLDDGTQWAVMQADDTKNIYWDVYLLEEGTTTGSFGANAKSDFSGNGEYGREGNYYTTMYSYFPYQLMDGVKAYYLPLSEESYDEEKKEVHFTEVTDGIVPSYSAVVLECPSVYNKSNNRLIPLMPENNPSTTFQSYNILNGYISLYDTNGNGPNKVTNNKNTMFILSKIGQDLGWFYFTNEYMTPNKAYLDLSPWEDAFHEHQNEAREIKFVFGKGDEEEATGVIAPKYAEKVDGALFDLNGRRVTDGDAYGLKKGIYISNGKKIVVKK